MIKKISPIIFGIFLIVLFELSLCVAGKIFLLARNIEDIFLCDKKFTKLIYCVGDSHTFGVGVSGRYSYPKQLETLLNMNNPDITFKVVNLGIPGYSTERQIDKSVAFFDRNRPDIVILLTGRNNYYEVKEWKNKSFLANAVVAIQKARTYRVMQYALNRLFKIESKEDMNTPSEERQYENYINYQLLRIKSLCEKYNCKLLIISYYNSFDEPIEKFAKEAKVQYFNLCKDFQKAVPEKDINRFISPDSSHMNLYGYKIFAELLYKKMYLHREALNLKLKPLTRKINKDSYCQNPATYYLRYLQGKSVFY